jgi:hypothetical protein
MTDKHAWVGPTKADEGWSEWIEWDGGECPIPCGVTHQVKHRDGEVVEDVEPDTWEWGHLGMDGDIIAYRYRLTDNTTTPEEEEEWKAMEKKQRIGGKRTAENFLHEAANLMADRGKQYDQPGGERSMGKAVAALNAITGRDLTEGEGWLLMSLVKRVRQHSGAGYHQDSAEDAVAYAALEAESLEASALRAGEMGE